MALTTTTTVSPAMVTYHQRKILARAEKHLKWTMFAQKGRVPKKNGKVVQFRRYAPLAPAQQLVEGVIPAGQALSQTQVTATRKPYADFVEFTDESAELTIDEIMADAEELIGEQIGVTQDGEARDVLALSNSVRRIGGHLLRSEITGADTLTVDDLTLLHADFVSRGVRGFVEYGGAYVFILDPYAKRALMKDEDFYKFVTSAPVDPQRRAELNVLGTFMGFYFVETNNPIIFAGAGAGGINVRCSVALGRDAYGISTWQDPKLIPKGFGSAGTADPVDQIATVGWKGAWVTVILEDLFMERLEHA